MKTMTIRLEYRGIAGDQPAEQHRWRVWREPRVSGAHWCSQRKAEVRTNGPQWAFDDGTGYVRYIGEAWAVAVKRLHGYVESYGMKLLQDLS